MTRQERDPTHEAIEAIIARAHRMRSEYVAALLARGALRLKQLLSGAKAPRRASVQHLHPDVG